MAMRKPDDSTVTISAGGRSHTMTGEQFKALPDKIARMSQQELPGTPHVTWEQLATAMAEEEDARGALARAKADLKLAKDDWDEAVSELRALGRRVRAQRIDPETGELLGDRQ